MLRTSTRLGVMLLVVFPLTLLVVATISASPSEMGPLGSRVVSVFLMFSLYGPVAASLVAVSHAALERRFRLRKPSASVLMGGLLGSVATLPLSFGPGSSLALLYGFAAGAAYAVILVLLAKSRRHGGTRLREESRT